MDQVKAGAKFINLIGFDDYVRPMILPAQNTTGIVIRTCINNGGRLFTGTVAPVYATLKTSPVVCAVQGQVPFEILIPAGQGLWYGPGNSDSSLYVTYDLLP
ncbi:MULTISPECIES: hypothetical protein [Pseudomonas]|uniref:hypothetical protein n=1 Tax=Pseudomonas TaxID=286 RepID=UPI00273318AF|nr:hypothetical protein [Pseudomonas sp. FP597]WLI07973.1 hypothetical protein PSH66_06465 [Pseudomonas sp. FP597]